MALFRFHKGSFQESILTTVIVKDIKELIEICAHDWIETSPLFCLGTQYQWHLRITRETMFDERCGWYSHFVIFGIKPDECYPVGFISEPLDEWEATL